MKQSSEELLANPEHKSSQEHLPEEKKETAGKKLTKAEQKKLDKEKAEEAERKLKEEQEEAPVPRERKTIMLKPNQKQIAKVYREEVRNYLNSKSSDVL